MHAVGTGAHICDRLDRLALWPKYAAVAGQQSATLDSSGVKWCVRSPDLLSQNGLQ